jgi:AcrR family transcriptional regulator
MAALWLTEVNLKIVKQVIEGVSNSESAGTIAAMKHSPTAPRRLAPDDRRKAILDTAIGLFGKHGYGNVSASDIAREARVTPALLHHYFGPKRNIYLAILQEWSKATVEQIHVDRKAPLNARVRANVLSWVDRIDAHPALWLATGGQGDLFADAKIESIVRTARERTLEIMLAVYADTVADTPVARRVLRGFIAFNQVALRAWLRGETDKETTVALLTETVLALLTVVIPSLERSTAHG